MGPQKAAHGSRGGDLRAHLTTPRLTSRRGGPVKCQSSFEARSCLEDKWYYTWNCLAIIANIDHIQETQLHSSYATPYDKGLRHTRRPTFCARCANVTIQQWRTMKPIEHGSSSPTLCLPSAPYHDIIAPGQYACMASNWCQKEKKFHCVYILFFICYLLFLFLIPGLN